MNGRVKGLNDRHHDVFLENSHQLGDERPFHSAGLQLSACVDTAGKRVALSRPVVSRVNTGTFCSLLVTAPVDDIISTSDVTTRTLTLQCPDFITQKTVCRNQGRCHGHGARIEGGLLSLVLMGAFFWGPSFCRFVRAL